MPGKKRPAGDDDRSTKKVKVDSLSGVVNSTCLCVGIKRTGKVRDQYILDDCVILVTTDRLSAFDRSLCAIPFKGQVLNQVSLWWFEKTKHIVDNQVLSTPHANVTVAKKCAPFPIEFVVRAYITGSSGTSLWTHYHKGVREYCGVKFPEDLVKNEKIDFGPVVTPTTKEEGHDRPISAKDIVSEGWMSQADYDFCAEKALEVFKFGQKEAAAKGLILVDTKYEFGKDARGKILLIDEVHTPDSSRYWIAASYEQRFAAGEEPENIDKEFIRLWFKERCDPYADLVLPEAPADLRLELSRRYVQLYEMITGQTFTPQCTPLSESMAEYVKERKRVVVVVDHESESTDVICTKVAKRGGAVEVYQICAVQSPLKVLELVKQCDTDDVPTVFVTVAKHTALPAILAAHSKYPVVNCTANGPKNYSNVDVEGADFVATCILGL